MSLSSRISDVLRDLKLEMFTRTKQSKRLRNERKQESNMIDGDWGYWIPDAQSKTPMVSDVLMHLYISVEDRHCVWENNS